MLILIKSKLDRFQNKRLSWIEGHSIMIQGPILQEDIKFLNVFAPKKTQIKYWKRNLMELVREIVQSTITVEYSMSFS